MSYEEVSAEELNDYLDNLEKENRELKAQVEHLREQLEYMAQQHRCGCGHPACNRCYDDKQNAIVLEATPAQCLAEIKAQAGRDAVVSALRLYGEPSMTVSEIVSLADKYANKLRQQAKGE